ncbi:MAG: hypothetical protein RR128_08300 [Clostridium sp.]
MTKTLYDPEVERKGMEKGIEKGIREAILDLLRDIGSVEISLQNIIEAQGNIDILKQWNKFAARSSSIEEFMKKIDY